ncbi:MAG: hypothetical protein ACOX3Q_13970 [Clostridia bacterium]
MIRFRRITCVLLVVLLLGTLIGCSGEEISSEETTTSTASTIFGYGTKNDNDPSNDDNQGGSDNYGNRESLCRKIRNLLAYCELFALRRRPMG